MNYEELPTFEFEDDLHAVSVRLAFSSDNLWKGKAIAAFRGRGVYEGMLSYQEKGEKVRHPFSFVLKEDSLKAFLKQIEHCMRHPDPEHEITSDTDVRLVRLSSDLNYCHIQKDYSEDETTPVLYLNRKGLLTGDSMVRDVMEYMYDQGMEVKWFATTISQDFTDETYPSLIPSRDRRKKIRSDWQKNEDEIREDMITLSEDILEPAFASLVKKNGQDSIDDIVFSTAAPGYDQTGRHYNGPTRAIYDDVENIVIIQTPVLSDEAKRETDLLDEKRAILEKFRAKHPVPVKKLKTLNEKVPEQNVKASEATVEGYETARKEAERIRNWLKPGNPQEWIGIALNQYEGIGYYDGVIQYGTTQLRFELLQRHYDFQSFLSLIEKVSVVDENGRHSVGNGEAKLKELTYTGGYYDIWDAETDEMDDQEPGELDDYVSLLPDQITKAQEDLSDTLIWASLRDGDITHVNINGKDAGNEMISITGVIQEMVPCLEDSLQEKLEWNEQEHASSLIVLTRIGKENLNVIMYDDQHNAIILRCAFA